MSSYSLDLEDMHMVNYTANRFIDKIVIKDGFFLIAEFSTTTGLDIFCEGLVERGDTLSIDGKPVVPPTQWRSFFPSLNPDGGGSDHGHEDHED